MPQRIRAPCTEDETHSPSVGAVAGLPICQNTLCFGDPAPRGRLVSGYGFPVFFLPWSVLGCKLTGGRYCAENTPPGYPSPLTGKPEGMPEAPQGSPQLAGQCEGWVKAVTHGGFRLHVLTCDGMEVPQHWVLRLLPLLWSCITFPSWGYQPFPGLLCDQHHIAQ